MKKLGKYKMYYWHRRLWSYLAASGDIIKNYWPGWSFNRDIENSCFPCHYAIQKGGEDGESKCSYCPFEWPNDKTCQFHDSLWFNWIFKSIDNDQRRKEIANIICNLPLKPYPTRQLAWYNRRFI